MSPLAAVTDPTRRLPTVDAHSHQETVGLLQTQRRVVSTDPAPIITSLTNTKRHFDREGVLKVALPSVGPATFHSLN